MNNFQKKSTMRPAILELLKHQTPLHISAIQQRLGTVTMSAVSNELSRMVNEGILRRAGSAIYEKKKKSNED